MCVVAPSEILRLCGIFAGAERAFQCIEVEVEVLKLWSALLFFEAEVEVIVLVNISLEAEVVALINVSLVFTEKLCMLLSRSGERF